MNKLFEPDELTLTDEGKKIDTEFTKLLEEFYIKHRKNNVSTIELKQIIYSCMVYLPIVELLNFSREYEQTV